MTNNHVKDISRIYLEQIVESSHLEPDMKKRRKKNKKAIEDMKNTDAYKSMAAAAAKKFDESKEKPKFWWNDDGDDKGYEKGEVSGKFKRKKKVEEATKPNDGNLANNYPPYDKVTRGDVISGALGNDQMGGKKKKVTKEGFSNWRQDLIEVMQDDDKEDNRTIIEPKKKIRNKIKTSATSDGIKIGESIENIGGQLVEMIQIDGVLDEFTDTELNFLSDTLIEKVVLEFFNDCIGEGYEVDEVEEYLSESINASLLILSEAQVTYGHDTPNQSVEKRQGVLKRVGNIVKKVGKRIARGAGYVAGATVRGVKAAGKEFKSGYERGRQGSSNSSSTSSPATQSSSDTDDKEDKPGILSRIGSKLKKGLSKAVAVGARAVSRGARNVARKMEGGESKKAEAPKAAPKKAEKPEDPWAGSATTPPKAKTKTKKAAAPKTKAPAAAKPKAKRKSKLDDLLASVRSESVIGDRARNAVADDRLSSEQEKTSASMDKLRAQTKRHGKSTALARTQASIAAKKSENTARGMHPKPKTGAYRVEETSVEKIDRISRERLEARRTAAQKEKEERNKSTAAFKKFKANHIKGGGTPVGALDAWQRKKIENRKKLATSVNTVESFELDEKTLTAAEKAKKEEIFKKYLKPKRKDFESRYPGRGEEVMHGVATKMAKKLA